MPSRLTRRLWRLPVAPASPRSAYRDVVIGSVCDGRHRYPGGVGTTTATEPSRNFPDPLDAIEQGETPTITGE
jgi:hypothetical protein